MIVVSSNDRALFIPNIGLSPNCVGSFTAKIAVNECDDIWDRYFISFHRDKSVILLNQHIIYDIR